MADQPMSEVEGRKPMYEFIGEHFYCDGIKVAPWQLTVEEIQKYIPEKFQDRYLNAISAKAIPNKVK
jgi:hypothetical protein